MNQPGRALARHPGNDEEGEHPKRRGDEGESEVGQPAPRVAGDGALPGDGDVHRAQHSGGSEVQGEQPEQRAGPQMRGAVGVDAILHQQVGEQSEAQ